MDVIKPPIPADDGQGRWFFNKDMPNDWQKEIQIHMLDGYISGFAPAHTWSWIKVVHWRYKPSASGNDTGRTIGLEGETVQEIIAEQVIQPFHPSDVCECLTPKFMAGKFVGCDTCRLEGVEANHVLNAPQGSPGLFRVKGQDAGWTDESPGTTPAKQHERQRKEILDLLSASTGRFLTIPEGGFISIEALKSLLTDWRFGIEGSIHYPMDEDGYHALANVLHRAYKDAASGGKGHARHGTDSVAFEDQDSIGHVAPLFGVGYLLGQATKKARESMRLPHEPAVRELLGAIVYIAGAIVHLEKKHSDIPF